MTQTTTTWLDTYNDWEWAVVPIPPGGKAPILPRWPEVRRADHTREEWVEMFDGQGMGVILGEASGNLIDVDLDSTAAARVCAHLMPMTLRGGRTQAPYTHLFYTVDDMPGDLKNRQFLDPVDGGRPIMEMRVNGQTLVAPSIHPTGDTYEWWTMEGGPTPIGWPNLAAHITLCAALALLGRHWPTGARHHAAMHLAGALLHDNGAYWSEGTRLEAAIEAVCAAADDTEVSDRLTAVRDTLLAFDNGKPVTGWSTLMKTYEGVGAGAAVQTAREWLSPLRDTAEEVEEEVEHDGEFGMFTTHRVDLRALIDEGVPEPLAVVPGFLWAGMEHAAFGEAGVGKTMLTCHLMEQLARKGQHSIWVDYQNGRNDLARRFISLRLDPDLYEYIHIIEYPPADFTRPEVLRDLQAMVLSLDVRMVVLDSMMDVLARARSEMNSGDDYNNLHQRALMPLRHTNDIALLVHDHSAKHNGDSSIGTSMKKNNVEIEWKIDNNLGGSPRTPSRTLGGMGYIVATAKKVRGGMVPKGFRVVWEVEPYGPLTTDKDTGIMTHAHTRVNLLGHYPPGTPVPVAGALSPPP